MSEIVGIYVKERSEGFGPALNRLGLSENSYGKLFGRQLLVAAGVLLYRFVRRLGLARA